jgi:hypothetical protein
MVEGKLHHFICKDLSISLFLLECNYYLPFDWCLNFKIPFEFLIFSIFHNNASIVDLAHRN